MAGKAIHSFVHCARCVREHIYADIEAGLTEHGIQFWCRNHDIEIATFTPTMLSHAIARGPVCNMPGHEHG